MGSVIHRVCAGVAHRTQLGIGMNTHCSNMLRCAATASRMLCCRSDPATSSPSQLLEHLLGDVAVGEDMRTKLLLLQDSLPALEGVCVCWGGEGAWVLMAELVASSARTGSCCRAASEALAPDSLGDC